MRYHYDQTPYDGLYFGEVYKCDHEVYDECTLYIIGRKGLAIIQQYWDPKTKRAWWGPLDGALSKDIYIHPKFKAFFDERAGEAVDGIYPTVSVRQIMWAMKMKPLKRRRWETLFDRKAV